MFSNHDGNAVWAIKFDPVPYAHWVKDAEYFDQLFNKVLNGNCRYVLKFVGKGFEISNPENLNMTYAIQDKDTGTEIRFKLQDGDWLVIDATSDILSFNKHAEGDLYKLYRDKRIPRKG